jgi:hypothetical protein
MKYARTDPPVSMDQLEQTVVPFNVAIESSFYHEIHVQPSKWLTARDNARWYDLVRTLRSWGLSHRGYDYPDWRQFSLLDFARPTRSNIRTDVRWYEDWDLPHIEDIVDINAPILAKDDIISILARMRVGLNSKKLKKDLDTLELYMFSFSYCKYKLISGSQEVHNSLLPIYNNIYSLLLVKFDLHPTIFANKSFWIVHSSLFLFPYDVGMLDIRTFTDERSWLVNNMGLLVKGVDGYV